LIFIEIFVDSLGRWPD